MLNGKTNVSGFAKRDHLGRTSDFDLGIWCESTSDELPLHFIVLR